ncbi:MAG: NAD(P)H-dependent oxidoreductase subunit E [Candidatus Bathyarchaeota archaeon]|nr:NAD(P)H-dependent oxidoreductase subunit E [Candidatus Bathyarchaeota archaeon]MDH5787504.1 NAD(P)H-dependent oxidoreductase subunit E [Candidatus Bathyarchaeota archaeon]
MDAEQKSVELNLEYGKIDAIIGSYSGEKSALIAILQEIENLYGYLPTWALKYVSKKLEIPMIQVYGVASFYDAFHLTPRGKHLIRVCLGTACYLRGSSRVLEAIENELGIKDGETTGNLKFTIQSVRCLGACALAPVMVIGESYFDKMTPTRAGKVLKQIQGKKEDD